MEKRCLDAIKSNMRAIGVYEKDVARNRVFATRVVDPK